MTIIPTIVSGLVSILLWFYVRHSIKRNLVDLFEINTKWPLVFDFLFLYCGFFRFLYRLQNPSINNSLFYLLINSSYVLLGFLGLILIFFILIDLKNIFEKYAHNPSSPAIDLSRRDFFKKNLAITGIATSTMVSGAGFANSFDPKVIKVKIPLPVEHQNLNGLKIVQLSDIHIGPTLKKDFCETIRTNVNAL
jgi:hypothetical protein